LTINNPFEKYKYWLPVWLLSATFVIGVLFIPFPNSRWLLSLKDVSILLFLVTNLAWIKDIRRIPNVVSLAVVALGLFSFLLSPAPLMAKSASLRQLLMPFVLFVIGMQFGRSAYELEKFKRWIIIATILLCAIGTLFYLVPVWEFISLRSYTLAKNLIPCPNGAPYMFYEPIRAESIPRMVSTILDPINLGHLLVFSLVIAFTEKRLNYAGFLFVSMCLIVTICKGAFLQISMTVILLLSTRIPGKLQIIIWLIGIRAFLFILSHHVGVLMHMQGLFLSIKSATWFGHGLGMVGNQASMYGNPLDLGISDTYIGAVLGQVGIIGLAAWLVPFVWMFIKLKENKTLKFLLVSQLVVAILSENSFNLMSILFLMMTVGATINELAIDKAKVIGIIDPVGMKAGMDYYSGLLAKAFAKQNITCAIFSNFTVESNNVRNYPFFIGHSDSKIKKGHNFFIGFVQVIFACIRIQCKEVIVHMFDYGTKELISLSLLKLFRIRTIAIIHDVESFATPGTHRLRKFILSKLTDVLVVHNSFSAEKVLDIDPQLNEKLTIIPHGNFHNLFVEPVAKDVARKKMNLSSDIRYILFFGQIKKVKGLDVAITALKDLPENIHMIIAGKPWKENFSTYDKLINELDLESRTTKMIRFIDDDERDILFSAADILVLPYNKIFQSGVMLMAMSARIPIVASDLEPMKTLIKTNETGFLFETGNADDLASVINKIINDRALLQQVTENAWHKTNTENDWDEIASSFKQLLKTEKQCPQN